LLLQCRLIEDLVEIDRFRFASRLEHSHQFWIELLHEDDDWLSAVLTDEFVHGFRDLRGP
jgi:hypothetical protein